MFLLRFLALFHPLRGWSTSISWVTLLQHFNRKFLSFYKDKWASNDLIISAINLYHKCIWTLWNKFRWFCNSAWPERDILHNTDVEIRLFLAVLWATCTLLACYQYACLASAWRLEKQMIYLNAAHAAGSGWRRDVGWVVWGVWVVDTLKVRGSAKPSLSGLSVLTSPAGWLPEGLSVRAADLSQAHRKVQGRIWALDCLLASLTPVTHHLTMNNKNTIELKCSFVEFLWNVSTAELDDCDYDGSRCNERTSI